MFSFLLCFVIFITIWDIIKIRDSDLLTIVHSLKFIIMLPKTGILGRDVGASGGGSRGRMGRSEGWEEGMKGKGLGKVNVRVRG